MPTQSDKRDAPGTGDEFSTARKMQPHISTSPAGVSLLNFLRVMYNAGDYAEEEYQSALKELAERAEEVLVEIAQASSQCDEQDYPLRLALVQAATGLGHPAAIPYLANIVKTPISEEKSTDPHSFSIVAEETIIRTTAVDGIAAHAKNGNDRAAELLLEFLRIPSFSIRRAAAQGLLASKDGEENREKIKELLPEDQRFILDLRKASVGEVPQVKDPTRYLKNRLEEGRTRVPPRLPEQPGSEPPKTY